MNKPKNRRDSNLSQANPKYQVNHRLVNPGGSTIYQDNEWNETADVLMNFLDAVTIWFYAVPNKIQGGGGGAAPTVKK